MGWPQWPKVRPRLIQGQLNVSGLVWQQLDGQNHRPCLAEVGDNKEGNKSKWARWWGRMRGRGLLYPWCCCLTFIYLDFMRHEGAVAVADSGEHL